MKYLFISFVLFFTGQTFANKVDSNIEYSPWVKKKFVIISSTKNYDNALAVAKLASNKLKQKLDLRGLTPDKKNGLTHAPKDCPPETHPCYFTRGRYDDGEHISIEYSNGFKEFAVGYYIVIIGSFFKAENDIITKLLDKAKVHFPDVYAKDSEVYLGCMH